MTKSSKRGSPWIVPPCDSMQRNREQLEQAGKRMTASLAATKKRRAPRKGK